jgi:hypothetical protein
MALSPDTEAKLLARGFGIRGPIATTSVSFVAEAE